LVKVVDSLPGPSPDFPFSNVHAIPGNTDLWAHTVSVSLECFLTRIRLRD
jgi:hypothetical protein